MAVGMEAQKSPGAKRCVKSPPSPATLCRQAASTNNLKFRRCVLNGGRADLLQVQIHETVSVNHRGLVSASES